MVDSDLLILAVLRSADQQPTGGFCQVSDASWGRPRTMRGFRYVHYGPNFGVGLYLELISWEVV